MSAPFIDSFHEINNDSYTVDTNDDAINAKYDKWNTYMHTTNGNISVSDYKIMQINSGNGNWNKNDMLLMCNIYKHDPDIVIVSESNFLDSPNNQNRRISMFPGYICHDKIFRTQNIARLTVLVKSCFECEREFSLENETNPTIILKLKISKNKYHQIIGNYRQWKGVSPDCLYNSRSEDDSIRRFEDMIIFGQM